MGAHETVIYRLVLAYPSFGALFAIFDFLGPKKGRALTGTPMSLGSHNPTKKLTRLVNLLGHLLVLSPNHVSNFSDLGPPPPKMLCNCKKTLCNIIFDISVGIKTKLSRSAATFKVAIKYFEQN